MPILVIGGTGVVGKLVIGELLERKQQIRVLSRNVAKAKAEFDPSVDVAEGDPTNAASVRAAAAGVERVFLLTQTPLLEGVTAQALKEAGVKHIVKISCIHADASDPLGSVMRDHGIAEAEVLKAGVPTTILRPHFFMQNVVNHSSHSIKTTGKFYHNQADAPQGAVDVRDIAACAATILTSPIDDYANFSFDITGGESLTLAQQAQIISEVTGKKVEAVALTDAQFFHALKPHMPLSRVHLLLKLGQASRLRPAQYFTGDVEIILGRPARTYRAFIEDNKAAFL